MTDACSILPAPPLASRSRTPPRHAICRCLKLQFPIPVMPLARNHRERKPKMRRLIVLLAVVLTAAAAMSAAASARTGDPRVCNTLTPGGTSRHGYWCAHNAAVAAVRTTMQNSQHVARWFPAVTCDQAGTLLRWRCFTFLGGDHWNLSVVFRATSAGWKRIVTVAP